MHSEHAARFAAQDGVPAAALLCMMYRPAFARFAALHALQMILDAHGSPKSAQCSSSTHGLAWLSGCAVT